MMMMVYQAVSSYIGALEIVDEKTFSSSKPLEIWLNTHNQKLGLAMLRHSATF